MHEPLMRIVEGGAEIKGEVIRESSKKDAPEPARTYEKREKTYIEELTTTLRGRDRQAKLDAVEILKDAVTVDALGALSIGIQDRDPRVQREAVEALKKLGKEMVVAGAHYRLRRHAI